MLKFRDPPTLDSRCSGLRKVLNMRQIPPKVDAPIQPRAHSRRPLVRAPNKLKPDAARRLSGIQEAGGMIEASGAAFRMPYRHPKRVSAQTTQQELEAAGLQG